MNAFLTSQVRCSPLVRMVNSRTLNYSINKLQERALGLVYNDSCSSFSELVKKDNSFPIHRQNI